MADFHDLRVAVADGVRLRVRHRPGTRRPAFVLVHGMGSNARVWDAAASRLAARHHPTYAVDLRGHGESDAPDEGHDIATAAADLAAVASALGLTGAVVAGHSWGGAVALRLAAEHPAFVGGLALVDGGWVDMTGFVPQRMRRLRDTASLWLARHEAGTAAEARASLRKVHPRWSDSAIEAELAGMRAGPDGLLSQPLSERHLMSIIESVWNERPDRLYPLVTVPVMLLPAIQRESMTGERQTREWVGSAEAALPRATVRWYLDADHYIHCEHPERLAGDLLDLAGTAGS
jgi:pimeloyl-ACP methyl ester carboxylesterase